MIGSSKHSITERISKIIAKENDGDLYYDGSKGFVLYLDIAVLIQGLKLSSSELSYMEESLSDAMSASVASYQEDEFLKFNLVSSTRLSSGLFNEAGVSSLLDIYGDELASFLRKCLKEYFVSKTFFSYKSDSGDAANFMVSINFNEKTFAQEGDSAEFLALLPEYKKRISIELPRTASHRRTLIAKKLAETVMNFTMGKTIDS